MERNGTFRCTFLLFHLGLPGLGNVDELGDAEVEAQLEALGSPLRHADVQLRSDRRVVLEAVKQDGSALFFADDALKDERALVLQAGQLITVADDNSWFDKLSLFCTYPARIWFPKTPQTCFAMRRGSCAGLVAISVCSLGCLTWSTLTSCAVGCFGDSHTEGIYGAPWVDELQRRLRRECVNFGRNAWTCKSVQRRAAQAPILDEAVVLAGTNDAMMELAARAGNTGMISVYRGLNQLPAEYVPSIESFATSFKELLSSVRAEKVAVLSLPPLGEANGRAAELLSLYNQEIHRLVEEDERAIYVPFGEALEKRSGEDFDASSPAFSQTIAQMFAHTALRRLPFGPSFDTLGSFYGREAVHDKIHLTEKSARILVDLLVEVLEPELQAAQAIR
eukprot:s1846_g6.t1